MARTSTVKKTDTAALAVAPSVQIDKDEQTFLEQAGAAISTFLKGVPAFLRRARELDQQADATLLKAKSIALPTTGDEDAAVQSFIKSVSAEKKYWLDFYDIAQKVHAVHKRLVARRTLTENKLVAAADLAQRLHNAYVESERQRAFQEQQRLQREADAKERERRDAELSELERVALDAEAGVADLSEREQAFLRDVFRGITPFNAAERAGYKDATKQSMRLMMEPKIAKALDELQQAEAARKQAEALKSAPIVAVVETVTPDIQKAAGTVDRTTWSAELLDERAFIDAAISGKYGVPMDCLSVNMPKVNELARSMRENLNRIPGLRAKKTTRTV